MSSDFYRGYEVDCNPDYQNYRVFKGKQLIKEFKSYDAALGWIDDERRRELKEFPLASM
jgi:hypothetical protein